LKNRGGWKPSKFVYKDGRLQGSRDPKEVSISSRLNADVTARWYDHYLPIYAKGKLLDLGCGKVPLFEAYSKRVSDITCVDWSASLHRNEFIDVECDLSNPLPFPDGSFDTIILSDVLEHIADPMQLCIEMARVLARNGALIMNVPFMYWLHEQPHDYYRYTEFALRRFATSAGLTPIELKATGGVPEILTDIMAKSVVRLPVLGGAIATALQSMTLWFTRTKLGQSVSAKTGTRFPLGYFMVAVKPI
jgi:SAM-dependent methyltransferase